MATIADLIETRFGLATEAGADRPAEGSLETLLGHRSHRRYRDAPVSDADLEVLLSASFSAPAKSDLQQAAVVVVRDPAKRAAIADLIPSMDWLRPVRFSWFFVPIAAASGRSAHCAEKSSAMTTLTRCLMVRSILVW